MSPTVRMGELVERLVNQIEEIEIDKSILAAAAGEQPITIEAHIKCNRTRGRIDQILRIMMLVRDPQEKKKVQTLKERIESHYPVIEQKSLHAFLPASLSTYGKITISHTESTSRSTASTTTFEYRSWSI